MSAFRLGWQLLFSPRKAFTAIGERKDSALPASLWIYAAFLVAYAAFYTLKPVDFPSMMEHSGLQTEGFFFWLRAGLLGTFLYAGWFAALLAFLNLAREGKLPLKILAQLLWVVAAAAALTAYAKHAVDTWLFLLIWVALIAPGVWLVRRYRLPWLKLLSLLVAVNVFSLVSFAPLGIAAAVQNENMYMGAQFLFLFWMLGVSTSGLRKLTDISLPRCFISLCLSFVVTIFLLFSLHLVGLVPPEMLKASMAI
jgi:hypothetical protein